MIKNKEWIMKEIKQHLWETEGESYTGYEAGIDFVKALIEEAEPQLNENQQTVLDWLKGDIQKRNPFASIKTLLCRADFDSDSLSAEVKKAYNKLDKNQEFHVLRMFGEWGLSQNGQTRRD